MAKEYRTYEDLVGEPLQDKREDQNDYAHGQMFNLPEWVAWWTARETWGKPTKQTDAKQHTIDLRVCGFVADAPEFWPTGMRGRMGGLVYTFPFTHHRDGDRTRHLCLRPFGRDGFLPGADKCPRCESFFETREATKDMEQKAAWEKIKVFGQRFSGLIFGYVNGDTSVLRAFEFSDTKPGKSFEKDPTFFQRVVSLCTDKSVPAASRIDPLFYTYKKERAQILRLTYNWVATKADMPYWQLTNIFKVGAEDGAPSTEVDPEIAERIRPWEWMDVKGEQERMEKTDGCAVPPKKAVDLDGLDYAGLMAYAMEKQMVSILEEGFEEDEVVALRGAIKKEVNK